MSDASSGAETDTCHQALQPPIVPSPQHTNMSGEPRLALPTCPLPHPGGCENRAGYSMYSWELCPAEASFLSPIPLGFAPPGP